MQRDPSPIALSGWKQLRLLPPGHVELTFRVGRTHQLTAPWSLGMELMADDDEVCAMESLWLPATVSRQTQLLSHVDRWLAALHEAFEPF